MNLPLVGSPTKSSARGKDLQHVAMLELLQHDCRPTFVVDATISVTPSGASIASVYHNKALAALDSGQFLALLQEKTLTTSTSEQRHEILGFSNWIRAQDARTHWTYAGHSWFKMSLASGYTVICRAQSDASSLVPSGQGEGAVLSKQISRIKLPTFDWTNELPPLKMTPHVAWARSIDWSQTPLGPMASWSSQLRSIANLVMQDSRPAVVFYGPDLIMIYNEAEIELLGGFHPCMGQSARVALASVWPQYFEPIITQNLAGKTVEKVDSPIHMVRNGFMEETYFSLKFIPIFGSDGTTVGHYEPLIETVSFQSLGLFQIHGYLLGDYTYSMHCDQRVRPVHSYKTCLHPPLLLHSTYRTCYAPACAFCFDHRDSDSCVDQRSNCKEAVAYTSCAERRDPTSKEHELLLGKTGPNVSPRSALY